MIEQIILTTIGIITLLIAVKSLIEQLNKKHTHHTVN